MPRIGNLENCKIYKIVSMNNPEMVYYGHTCQTLAQRFASHKSKSNKTTSKIIIDKGDAIILLVEDYPCLNENEARAREGFYILNNVCVNKNVAGRTKKEFNKKYYIDNNDKLIAKQKQYDDAHKEQKKQYQMTNKEKISLRMKQYYQNKKRMQLNINNNAINPEII